MQLKTVDSVHNTFHHAINWNALLFIVMNISYTIISTTFFYRLSSDQYNMWANINSFIYIILLWCDCGFRKSIPLYLPRIEANKQNLKNFTRIVLTIQLIACSLGLSALSIILYQLTQSLIFVGYGLCIFLLEAPLVILQSLYHGKFLNKSYNGIMMSLIMAELSGMSLLFFIIPSSTILHVYFICKIIFLISSNGITGFKLIKYFRSNNTTTSSSADQTIKKFLHHSATMWWTTNLRSLSERNIMVPFLTFTVGPNLAYIYKIGNDWALFIQRAIIKSIGTTDISLIAHINHFCNFHDINKIFQKIMIKIIKMTIPSILIVGLSIIYQSWTGYSLNFIVFLLLIISYLIEILLSPYQRILEAQQHYKFLFFTHCTYLLIPLSYLLLSYKPWNLINLLLIFMIVRVFNSLLSCLYASWLYTLSIPRLSLSLIPRHFFPPRPKRQNLHQ